MNKLFVLGVCIIFYCTNAFAIPQLVNYQGSLTNLGGTPLDTTVSITFKLYNGSGGGATLLWTEVHPTVVVNDGLFDRTLGSITALNSNVFNNTEVWLGVKVGTNTEMTPRERITSVGYSYRVGTVDGASGGTISSDLEIVGRLEAGQSNVNTGANSTAFGGNNNVSGDYSNASGYEQTLSGDYSAIGGGFNNSAISFGNTIGGGSENSVSNPNATICGGDSNRANGIASFLGGGETNYISNAGPHGVLGGGQDNTVSGLHASIVGGFGNNAAAVESFIGGGDHNEATGHGSAVVGGGANDATGQVSFVGGGTSNIASGDHSVVVGGDNNTASGNRSAILGGANNEATELYSTVLGGLNNSVTNWYSTACGKDVTANGRYNFICGANATVTSDCCFVWSDGSGPLFSIGSGNTFSVKANGGVRFWTTANHGDDIGTRLAAGGSSWIALSDSNKKTNRVPANSQEILQKISEMPVDQWNYKHQADGPQHVGPMAQDFWSAFHLGEDSLGIETIDADGVLFAAVQELAKRNEMLESKNAKMESEIAELKSLVNQLIQLGQK